MNRSVFLAYLDAYNSNKSRLKKYYSEDLIFENPAFTLSGSKLLEFLSSLHGVVEDHIDPIPIVMEGANIALFGTHVVHALKDADLPIGRFQAGDSKAIGLFAFYETSGNRFTRIRLSFWPEGRL
jgi:hypothetical protein